jgi:hypothetical protein
MWLLSRASRQKSRSSSNDTHELANPLEQEVPWSDRHPLDSRRSVVVHRPFEAPHNATTIRDRFSIPDANTVRSTWADTGCLSTAHR